MREILFRAKRKDNGEWVEGDLIQDRDLRTFFICGFNYYNGETGLAREEFMFEVNPSTVCQYTGLTDKNKEKIWDGDIVDILCEVDENGVIEWSDDLARFVVQADGFVADFDNYLGQDLEVITNRFDNPELLGCEANDD